MPTLLKAELRDAFTALSKIASRAPEGQQLYTIRDKFISAANMTMMAAAPLTTDSDLTLTLPAVEFEKLVSAFPGDIDLEVGKRTVQLKSGKARASLARFDDELVRPKPTITDAVVVSPGLDFVPRLKLLSAIIEDAKEQNWEHTVMLSKGRMVAMYKRKLMLCALDDNIAEVDSALLPLDLVNLITARKIPPTEIEISDRAIMVTFGDETWVHSTLVQGQAPEKLFEILGTLSDAEYAITGDLKAGFAQATALGAKDIEITQQGMIAKTDAHEIAVDMELPVTGRSMWDAAAFKKMLDVATHIDFEADKTRANFSAEGVRGTMSRLG